MVGFFADAAWFGNPFRRQDVDDVKVKQLAFYSGRLVADWAN